MKGRVSVPYSSKDPKLVQFIQYCPNCFGGVQKVLDMGQKQNFSTEKFLDPTWFVQNFVYILIINVCKYETALISRCRKNCLKTSISTSSLTCHSNLHLLFSLLDHIPEVNFIKNGIFFQNKNKYDLLYPVKISVIYFQNSENLC